MSLQVWLPMTKDLRQQGLSDVTVTNNGATFNSAGKLGGSYNLTSGPITLSNLPNPSEVSVAFWFKRTANTNTCQFMFTAWNGVTCELTTDGRPTFAVYRNSYPTITGNAITTSSGWVHYCGTFSSTEGMKLYINGSLIASNTTTTSISWNTTTGQIGKYSTYASMSAQMNDFRIYDHCLSPMEVKRISQGLILHYPLNNMGFGQENLAKNSNLGWNSTTYNVIQGEMYEDWVVGDTYTITIKGTPSSGCKFGLWSDAGNAHMCYFYNKIKDNIWIATAICSASQNTAKFSVWDYPSNNPTHNAHIEWIKIEKGSISTPWSPAPSDDLATQMGLNSNIEYDTSGYCNNATKNKTFTYISDTPKYSVSAKFDGTNSATTSSIFDSTTRHSELTIATWIKRTSDDANYHYYLSSSGVSAGIRSYNSVNNYYLISWNHATDSSSSTNSWVNTVMPLNTWVHNVWTFNHGVMKHYINGELEGTSNRSATGTYILGDICSIIGTGYSASSNWEGGLSDLRIYATALSADDVKSLYQNTATIDANGTIHGAVR